MTDEFSDALELHASLLEDLSGKWQNRVVDEVDYCEELAKAVEELALSLYKAKAGEGNAAPVKKKQAEEQLYYRFDLPFRKWLREIDPEGSLKQETEHLNSWREIAAGIAMAYGRELVEEAGPGAVVGRTVKETRGSRETERHYSAGEAFNKFLYQINQIKIKDNR